jgi:hypothetical protein
MLTPTHIYIAAIIAFFATLLINRISRLLTLEFVVRTAPDDAERLDNKYNVELFDFKEKVIERGNIIHVITHRKREYKGVFVGIDEFDIICVRNGNQVICGRLQDIAEIKKVASSDNV